MKNQLPSTLTRIFDLKMLSFKLTLRHNNPALHKFIITYCPTNSNILM